MDWLEWPILRRRWHFDKWWPTISRTARSNQFDKLATMKLSADSRVGWDPRLQASAHIWHIKAGPHSGCQKSHLTCTCFQTDVARRLGVSKVQVDAKILIPGSWAKYSRYKPSAISNKAWISDPARLAIRPKFQTRTQLILELSPNLAQSRMAFSWPDPLTALWNNHSVACSFLLKSRVANI